MIDDKFGEALDNLLHDSEHIHVDDDAPGRLMCFTAGVFVGAVAAALLMILAG